MHKDTDMNFDWDSLMGKEVKIIDTIDLYETDRGYIVGCNPWIGITLVNAYDHKDYLYCLHCEMSPYFTKEERQQRSDMGEVANLFSIVANQLRLGYFSDVELTSKRSTPEGGGRPSSNSCAFGQ